MAQREPAGKGRLCERRSDVVGIELRLGKKTDKCGIGQRRDPLAPRKKIRAVSPKQRKREGEMHENYERVLAVQYELYKENFCTAGAGEWKDRCPNNKRQTKLPLQPDHVNTRNQKNADRHGNLQPLCSWCNHMKGSRRIDFRTEEFRRRCEELDKEMVDEDPEGRTR